MAQYIYKNETLLERTNYHISIDDRSFRFGDGCFETIPFFQKKCLEKKAHLKRLQTTCSILKINLNFNNISKQIDLLIQKNHQKDGLIRVICSRGEKSIGFLPTKQTKPYYLIDSQPNLFQAPKHIKLHLVKSPFIFKKNSIFQRKTNNGLLHILARIEAEEHGCFEALIRQDDGTFSECSSSNFCLLRQKKLLFPPTKGPRLLGITETILKKISPFPYLETPIFKDHLLTAKSCYIFNSSWGILSVQKIPLYQKEFELYENDSLILSLESYIKGKTHV